MLAASSSALTECTFALEKAGVCTSGSTNGHELNISGMKTSRTPRSSATGREVGKSGPIDESSDAQSNLLATATKQDVTKLATIACTVATNPRGCFQRTSAGLNPNPTGVATATPAASASATPGTPARVITITDLARFLPVQAALHAEPDGWAVVGVPANFWVDVSAMTVSAPLLGENADVRFTPQLYTFDYGDAGSRTTAEAGRSWASLGQQELTVTPTGHTYTSRGARQATVTVYYSAEYRFAGGAWTGVDGAVRSVSAPVRQLVVVERTALTTLAARG